MRPAGAEIVNLVNGDRITGKVVSSSDEKLCSIRLLDRWLFPKNR